MTTAIFGHGRPWTEEDFLALGETNDRVELFDGSLFVTPAPTPRHQRISRRLANALDTGELEVHEAVNVRLRPGRVPIPDVVVTDPLDFDEVFVSAAVVRMVCEIVSPSNASADKVLKMHYYAAAAIPWYLLVEQDTGALHLYRLSGDRYLEHSVTLPGGVLTLTDPVQATIRPEDLLPPG
ncbi:Uma2 family endonuclease [Krasilnikovia cinnamomea]|uniref:Uma2 family endonuclease n=1 Tax=Krasilnikovia cinnamomea TaxID=349313 RepID=A0A4Q7ZH76_9ACTN|nr:Uma2 family endonuclease [Krasilnikovia cinnamomea]RZU50180.1 Uma2 family endonuclease [Krasilnikovia cinnamomea]